MIALLGIIKSIPAAVLATLAGTNHMIEGDRPMAETIMPQIVDLQVAQYTNEGRNYLHRYACVECSDHFLSTSANVKMGKRKCNSCSMADLAVKRRKHGHRSRVLHGASGSGQWKAHHSMLGRCYDSRCNGYENYGGRGITVCDKWQTFEGFMQWDKFSEWSKGMQLDRIDNDGNYEPSNCRWVTLQENSQRRRSTVMTPENLMLIRIFSGSGVGNNDVDRLLGLRIGATYNVIKQGAWSNA